MSLTLRNMLTNHAIRRLNVGDPHILQWVVVDEYRLIVDGMICRFIHADDNTLTFTDTRTDEYVEVECEGSVLAYDLANDDIKLFKEVIF